jgi:hypothetical protein
MNFSVSKVTLPRKFWDQLIKQASKDRKNLSIQLILRKNTQAIRPSAQTIKIVVISKISTIHSFTFFHL